MIVGSILQRVLMALVLVAVAYGEETSPWRTDIEKALADADGKPVALLFSSDSCPPCLRMLVESAASEEVKKALKDVVGIVVKSKQHPYLSEQFNIRATPTLVLVNRKRQLVDQIGGYLPSSDLVTTLKVLNLYGDERGDKTIQLQNVSVADILGHDNPTKELIALLGKGNRDQRLSVRQALISLDDIDDELWPLLTHKQLGIRLDARAILQGRFPNIISNYDPMAKAPVRAQSAASWKNELTETVVP